MKWLTWWQKKISDEEIEGLELKLQSALTPVAPRPEFAEGLRKRLLKQTPEISVAIEARRQKIQTGLLITGGVFGAVAMIFTGIRGIVSVVGIIGLLISMIKQEMQDAPAVSN